jgi:hypothetical protein
MRAAHIALLSSFVLVSALARAAERADTALVLAVDVSGSVDPYRYLLQMQGIARAFEDAEVQANAVSGRHGRMLVALVEWSDKPVISIPWTLIASAEDATAFADRVLRTPRAAADFTCMAKALQVIADKLLPLAPMPAGRTVIDVSGDGHDNCNPERPVDTIRDELVALHVTINGLPILEGEEAATLDDWYRQHVIGGPGAFALPAYGFDDFARAMRDKFALEVSAVPRPQPRLADGR